MLLGTLGASLLGGLLIRKGIVRASTGNCSLNSSTSFKSKKGKGILRAGAGHPSYENKKEWDF